MSDKRLLYSSGAVGRLVPGGGCKTRPNFLRRGLPLFLTLLALTPLAAQQKEADDAWNQGQYDAARRGYQRLLRQDPGSVRANLRLAILLSWDGRLDSALVLIARARAVNPTDAELATTHSQIRSWDKQYNAALALYDSVLTWRPGLRDAELGRARTLAWAGRLGAADSAYGTLIQKNASDRDARLGQAQVNAWRGRLPLAQQQYGEILARDPRDADALVGQAQVYYWQGKVGNARSQLRAALAVDSTLRSARELRRTIDEATRPLLEATAAWSNDSDRNTSFWQTLGSSGGVVRGVTAFGSVNALETSDPLRDAKRVGGEAGVTLALGRTTLSGAAGARRLMPYVAPDRTSATYRGRLSFRPAPAVGFHVGYSRLPFDEIAALMERALDLELVEGGVDARPFRGFSIYASRSQLWLNDGNTRSGVVAGLTQKLNRRVSLGLFGRTLSYEERGVGYFSPDRFSVLEATAGYAIETRAWGGSIGGGLGAQQVGRRGAAQTEWHLEGRVGRGWGVGNRLEAFGMVTNSAVSSTSGAFRYRSAGLNLRLGL